MRGHMLIVAFRDTIAEHVAKKIDDSIEVEVVYLDSSIANIATFCARKNLDSYEYIVGIGEYGGHRQDAIRIETACSSQFRNDKSGLRQIIIPYFIEPNMPFTCATGIGNSWCNLLSYQLLSKRQGIQYTFLHIPKNFDVKIAAEAITAQLTKLPII